MVFDLKTKKRQKRQTDRQDIEGRTRVIISKKQKTTGEKERKEGGDRDKKVIIIQKTKHRFLSLVKKQVKFGVKN